MYLGIKLQNEVKWKVRLIPRDIDVSGNIGISDFNPRVFIFTVSIREILKKTGEIGAGLMKQSMSF